MKKQVTITFKTKVSNLFDVDFIKEVLEDCQFGLNDEESMTLEIKIEDLFIIQQEIKESLNDARDVILYSKMSEGSQTRLRLYNLCKKLNLSENQGISFLLNIYDTMEPYSKEIK